MSIFRDVSIRYDGTDYTVTPSVRLLRLIEARARRDDPAFNLAMAVYRMTRGDVAHGDIAFIVAEIINANGGRTTADHAWEYLQGVDVAGLNQLIADLASCFIAPDAKAKKPTAPEMTTS